MYALFTLSQQMQTLIHTITQIKTCAVRAYLETNALWKQKSVEAKQNKNDN